MKISFVLQNLLQMLKKKNIKVDKKTFVVREKILVVQEKNLVE